MLGCGAAPEAGSWVLPGGKFDRLKPIERANHLVDQIESFRIGDKDNKREDDLLDTFCYGIAIGLGNSEGF